MHIAIHRFEVHVMITYSVKKNKQSRISFRIAAIIIMLIPAMQIALFIMGYGRQHKIVLILCIFLFCYGIYLFIHTMRKNQYDHTYTFDDDAMHVKHKYGEDTIPYSEIIDVNQIIPENENLYSIIQVKTAKEQYIIPFSFKKEMADAVYKMLLEHVTVSGIQEEVGSIDDSETKS